MFGGFVLAILVSAHDDLRHGLVAQSRECARTLLAWQGTYTESSIWIHGGKEWTDGCWVKLCNGVAEKATLRQDGVCSVGTTRWVLLVWGCSLLDWFLLTRGVDTKQVAMEKQVSLQYFLSAKCDCVNFSGGFAVSDHLKECGVTVVSQVAELDGSFDGVAKLWSELSKVRWFCVDLALETMMLNSNSRQRHRNFSCAPMQISEIQRASRSATTSGWWRRASGKRTFPNEWHRIGCTGLCHKQWSSSRRTSSSAPRAERRRSPKSTEIHWREQENTYNFGCVAKEPNRRLLEHWCGSKIYQNRRLVSHSSQLFSGNLLLKQIQATTMQCCLWPKFDSTRKWWGIYFVDDDDKEFKETMNNVEQCSDKWSIAFFQKNNQYRETCPAPKPKQNTPTPKRRHMSNEMILNYSMWIILTQKQKHLIFTLCYTWLKMM